MTFVLDNSVAMRWCFESTTHPYAEAILDRLETGDDALVPVLWLYEASAVLAREQSRGILAAQTRPSQKTISSDSAWPNPSPLPCRVWSIASRPSTVIGIGSGMFRRSRPGLVTVMAPAARL